MHPDKTREIIECIALQIRI